MEKKGKDSGGKCFTFFLFGLNMEGKERKYMIFVWIDEGKERKGKYQVLIYWKRQGNIDLLKKLNYFYKFGFISLHFCPKP